MFHGKGDTGEIEKVFAQVIFPVFDKDVTGAIELFEMEIVIFEKFKLEYEVDVLKS